MRILDGPGDGIQRPAAQRPNGSLHITSLPAAASGVEEIPEGKFLRLLKLPMVRDGAGVLLAQGARNGEVVKRPVVDEGQFIIGMIPFVAHIVAEMDLARSIGDVLHRTEDVGEIAVPFEQFIGLLLVERAPGHGEGQLQAGDDLGAV